jgi:hypothetical protein
MNSPARRAVVSVVIYIVCLGINHYSQEVINPFDPHHDSLISMTLLLGVPLFASFLLWIGKIRWGSILLLGCFPAVLFYVIDSQFLHPHYRISVAEASAFWVVLEYLSFGGAILTQGVIAWIGVHLLRVGPEEGSRSPSSPSS